MKIVIAPNAFKESLDAWSAARALAKGLRQSLPRAQIVLVPMADGGDGTIEVLVRGRRGRFHTAIVPGPLGRPVRARYGLLDGGSVAAIEMAQASGLRLLAPKERNPMKTSTFGTGLLMRTAVERGARRLIVGVGGSATVDGGAGMAAALGYRFLDKRGRLVPPNGGGLARIERVDPEPYLKWKQAAGGAIEVSVVCDVNNLLLGPKGAARVFGPQKGASPAQVARLEEGLARLADAIQRDLGISVRSMRGGGAAGGLGAGLIAFCGATLCPGAALVAEIIGLEEKLAGADWVITGEGRLDRSTLHGKAPAWVLELARKQNARVIGVAGSIADAPLLRRHGFDALFSLCDGPVSLEDGMRRARPLLTQLGRSLGAIIAAGR